MDSPTLESDTQLPPLPQLDKTVVADTGDTFKASNTSVASGVASSHTMVHAQEIKETCIQTTPSELPPRPNIILGSATSLSSLKNTVVDPATKPVLQLYPIRTLISVTNGIQSIDSGSNPSLHSTERLDKKDSFKHIQAAGSRKSSISSVKSQGGIQASALNRSFGALRDDPIGSMGEKGSQDLIPSTVVVSTYQTEIKDQVGEIQNVSGPAIVMGYFGEIIPNQSKVSSSRRSSLAPAGPVPGVMTDANWRSSRRSSIASSFRMRRVSIGSEQSQKSHSSSHEPPPIEGVDREVELSEYNLKDDPLPMNANADYYDYIRLSQRFSSSNFIQKLDSTEVMWTRRAKKVKMIGRFLVGEQIGKGSFGKVKEGICSETLLRVAIKIISKKRARRIPQGIQGVIREIKMLRQFKHENVITIIDVYCKVEDQSGSTGVFPWFEAIEDEPITWLYADGTKKEQKVNILKFYLVFQYCPWTLQGILEKSEGKKFTIDRAHYFFVQMMQGLSYLHAQSVIHRDIKPGNMLITSGKILNISDFGVAEKFDIYSNAPMTTSTFAGTHQFLSPEVTSGKDDFDGEKVDIWAAGVTLYNMLTGRYPFESNDDGNILELYEKISACHLVLPSDLDPSVQNLLRGMLAKDPAQRFTVVQVLSHPWTQTHYLGVNRNGNHTKQNVAGISSKSVLTSFKETTMMPFLQQLFSQEIEKHLEDDGSFEPGSKIESIPDSESESTSSMGTKKKKNLLSKLFFRK